MVDHQRAPGAQQAITLRIRMSEQYGACFELSGSSTTCVPTPSSVLQIESLPGLPADRIPRLHAVAEALRGQLDAQRLRAMPPEDARAELQQLPGIGPFYSSLIVIRACGHADAPSLGEPGRGRRSKLRTELIMNLAMPNCSPWPTRGDPSERGFRS